MNEELQHRLREKDRAFVGKIGADISHETRNVLSVIGEYAGLLEDLLTVAKESQPPDHVKLKKLSASITTQVKKGTRIMERLSRFAHAADEEATSSDMTTVTENIVALAERHITFAGHKLHVELPEKAIRVRTNPFGLQHAIFCAIELILESLERAGQVNLKLVDHGPKAIISLWGDSPATRDLADRISDLSALMSELKGNIEDSFTDGKPSLTLSFPTE